MSSKNPFVEKICLCLLGLVVVFSKSLRWNFNNIPKNLCPYLNKFKGSKADVFDFPVLWVNFCSVSKVAESGTFNEVFGKWSIGSYRFLGAL